MSWLDPFLYGRNAYTYTATGFIQPAGSAPVTVTLEGAAWLEVGQYVYVEHGGTYTVRSIQDSTRVVLVNTAYAGNAAPGTLIVTGSKLVASGILGPSGGVGGNGSTGASGATGAGGSSGTTGGGGASGTGGVTGAAGLWQTGSVKGSDGTLTSTSYTNVGGGASASATILASGQALVTLSWQFNKSAAGSVIYMSVALSGANTVAASDSNAVAVAADIGDTGGFPNEITGHGQVLLTGLTPGATTFAQKFRCTGGGTWNVGRPTIVVLPL